MKYTYAEGKYKPVKVTMSNYDKLDNVAKDMYNSFRVSTNDISSIAKNTGWDLKDIEQIKNHVFVDKLRLDDGLRQLDPDYEMAVAWDRMKQGKFYESDILLLKHELHESTYYKIANSTQREAHDATVKIFDWNTAIEKLGGE